MSTGKVVLGVIAGAAAGAVLGILFAPDKGSETRKKIAGKGHDMADGLKEKLDSVQNYLWGHNFTKIFHIFNRRVVGTGFFCSQKKLKVINESVVYLCNLDIRNIKLPI